MKTKPETLDALQAKFGALAVSEFREQVRVVVPRERLLEVVQFLRDERTFALLVDVTCVDYLGYPTPAPGRFGLVYLLADPATNERITLRVYVDETDVAVPSIVALYTGADWLEREVYDMFGIVFAGHPDLRRILLPEEFVAFPLRKDYPLQGNGERHNFPVLTREDS